MPSKKYYFQTVTIRSKLYQHSITKTKTNQYSYKFIRTNVYIIINTKFSKMAINNGKCMKSAGSKKHEKQHITYAN